jgi:hypothetical protein
MFVPTVKDVKIEDIENSNLGIKGWSKVTILPLGDCPQVAQPKKKPGVKKETEP